MSTRDLGTHVVELHDSGTLAITGEGTRLTLPPHEALALADWLHRQHNALQKAAKIQDAREQEAWQQALPEEVGATIDERDVPVDEP